MPNISPLVLSVIVKNRDKVLFEGMVKAISSINEKGVFDILPEHSNFISVIQKHIIIHKTDGSSEEIPCQQGVIRVEANRIKAYVDILQQTA